MTTNETPRYTVINTGPGIWYVKNTATTQLLPFKTKRAATAYAAEANAR